MKNVLQQETPLASPKESPLVDFDVSHAITKFGLKENPEIGRFVHWGLVKTEDCPA